jgi:hypothetical protein
MRLTVLALAISALFVSSVVYSHARAAAPAGVPSISPPVANEGNTEGSATTTEPIAFDVCIQDDSDSHRGLLFNSQTGSYIFCCDGTSVSGVGVVKIKGSVISLTAFPQSHKLVATVNNANHRANAALQFPHATVPCTIYDRNTLDDSCSACGAS